MRVAYLMDKAFQQILKNDLLPTLVYGEIRTKRIGRFVTNLPKRFENSLEGRISQASAVEKLKKLVYKEKSNLAGFADIPEGWK